MAFQVIKYRQMVQRLKEIFFSFFLYRTFLFKHKLHPFPTYNKKVSHQKAIKYNKSRIIGASVNQLHLNNWRIYREYFVSLILIKIC